MYNSQFFIYYVPDLDCYKKKLDNETNKWTNETKTELKGIRVVRESPKESPEFKFLPLKCHQKWSKKNRTCQTN